MKNFYTFFNTDKEQFNDKKTYDLICNGNCLGLFQLETVPMINFCKSFKPRTIEDLSIALAAVRPDTMSFIPDLIKYKEHPEEIVYIHPDMKPILEETYGQLLFQEQTIAILKKFGGFTGGESDSARRVISKKKKEEIQYWADLFKKKSKELGYSEEVIISIYDYLVNCGSYSFNKSHSISYAITAYYTAFLKANYPVEFMTSVLSNQKKDDGTCDYESLSKYLAETKSMGITILPPDINKSDTNFIILSDGIRFGLGLIKGLGKVEQNSIFDNRPFSSFEDYLVRCSTDKTSTIALIKSGAFSFTNKSKIELLKEFFQYRYNSGNESKKPLTRLTVTHIKEMLENGIISYDELDSKGKAKDPDKLLFLYNKIRGEEIVASNMKEYTEGTELDWEFETLNMFVNKTPFDDVSIPDWNLVEPDDGREPNCYIGGVINAINKKKIKTGRNKGKPFAFVSIDTAYGKIEATFFAPQYEEFGEILKTGACLVLRGHKDSDTSLVASKAETLKSFKERTGQV